MVERIFEILAEQELDVIWSYGTLVRKKERDNGVLPQVYNSLISRQNKSEVSNNIIHTGLLVGVVEGEGVATRDYRFITAL